MDGGQTVFNPLFSKKTSVIFSLCCVVEALIKAKKAPSVLTLQVIPMDDRRLSPDQIRLGQSVLASPQSASEKP